MNQPPEKPLKTVSEIAAAGACCGNCAYFSHWKHGRCTLKTKHVSSYNICERHTEMK
jgi:hypothetical protein